MNQGTLKKKLTSVEYKKKNPLRAKAIQSAVKQGIKQYGETFKRLATT